MFAVLTVCFSVALYPAPADDPARPPLKIAFKRFCGPAEERDLFDPRSGSFHIHFIREGDPVYRISQASVFEVEQVSRRPPKSLTFRLTGMPERPMIPLRMVVGDMSYPLEPHRHDKNLFKVERRDDALWIEFTEKGIALLKPRTRFSFVEMTW